MLLMLLSTLIISTQQLVIEMTTQHGSALISRPDDPAWIGILFVVASITGAIGGCAGAAHIFLMQDKPIRLLQLIAYGVIGMFLGLLSFGIIAAGTYFGMIEIHSIEALIGFTLAFGFGGSLFLSGTNIIIQWTTKHLGDWEIKFTARPDSLDRRDVKKRKK